MRYIETLHEGETTVAHIYLMRRQGTEPYDNLILQDKTGTLDGKSGIRIQMELQITAKKILLKFTGRSEGEYDPADYMPTSEKSVDGMYEELMRYGKQAVKTICSAG